MDDVAPTLEVGFAIDASASFDSLTRLDDMIDRATANAVQEIAKVERASKGMLDLRGATTSITSFGNAATRELQAASREISRVERSGEGMVRSLERQSAAFGKSREELRGMKAEAAALAAEQTGNSDLAQRIRAAEATLYEQEFAALRRARQEAEAAAEAKEVAATQAIAAAEREARAVREAAFAYDMFEAAARRGAVAMREQATAEALAAKERANLASAAERLRGAIDPAYAAQARFNAEMAGARALTAAGAITLDEYCAKLRIEQSLLAGSTSAMSSAAAAGNAQRFAVQNLGFQVQDFAVQVVGGTSALRAFAQQAPQAAGALAGFEGKLGAVGAFLNGPWGIALTLGITLAAGFADSLLRSGEASEKAGDAHRRHANATEALTDAIQALNAVSGIEHTMSLQRAADAETAVRKQKAVAEATLATARATLVKAQADAKVAAASNVPGAPSYAGTGLRETATAGYARGVAATVADLTKQIDRADQSLRGFSASRLDRRIEAQFDRNAAAVQRYDAAHERLTGQLQRGAITEAGYLAGMREATAARNAVTEADRRGRTEKVAHATASRGLAAVEREHAKAAREAAAAVREQEAAERALQTAVDGLQSKFDPVTKALRDYFDAVDTIEKAVGSGILSRALGTDWMMKAAAEYGDAVDKMNEATGKLKMPDTDDLAKTLNASMFDFTGDAQRSANSVLSIGDAFNEVRYAANGLFSEHSKGMRVMATAEKALTVIQLARTAVDVAGGAARMFATLGPFAFPAVAAMIGVMAALGFGGGGGGSKGYQPKDNTGTGTVLGDSTAKSESLKRSIDMLREVDLTTSVFSRQMAASLRSIDKQIGGLAGVLVRSGSVEATAGTVAQGFKTDAIGSVLSKIPLIGGFLGSLFGTKTKVVGQGIFANDQRLDDILANGFDAGTYADVQKKKKFFGLTTSTKYKTQYGGLDGSVSDQFGAILASFDDAIRQAAGPLGVSTDEISRRLNGFVVSIGKIDLQGLTGEQIQEKLTNVFGAVGDKMAEAALPGISRYQKVGEGALETLVRVATTVDAVTIALGQLSSATTALGIDAKLGLADQFDSVSDFSSAVGSYFETYYSKAEQAAAKTAQLSRVFDSLGLSLPSSLDGFRKLVEAQDLTTEAGRATYAELLKLAPAFADLKSAMDGARSAADILAEQQDLQRQLLELQGNTAALRALDLAKLDPSNRALQEQINAIKDAQAAAEAATQLRDAWKSVGDTIMDEVRRIRGLADDKTGGGFVSLMGQFNAANASALRGDMDAAKSLPQLSQALLAAAADSATSRQELDRIRAEVAATLERTSALVTKVPPAASAVASVASAQIEAGTSANDNSAAQMQSLRDDVANLTDRLVAALATIAGNTGRLDKRVAAVTEPNGGGAITVASAAA